MTLPPTDAGLVAARMTPAQAPPAGKGPRA
jgi:hypothetical protein